ncbi:MAG: hypothetical protein CVU97_01510 [Firmicutes bacterium HGW-Firmicutes-21]|nr:MAG: hypothetical protein CVU97_01510 [Firmicutes bacterium HGW-Firmicutes-21]
MAEKTVKIMIDVGHAGKENRSPVYRDYWESIQMWRLRDFLIPALKQYPGFEIGETRSSQTQVLEVTARGRKAKGYDLLLSLHSNAADSESVDRVSCIYQVPDEYSIIDDKSKAIAEIFAKGISQVMQTKDPPKWYSRLSDADRNKDGLLNDNYYGILHGAWMVGVAAVIMEHSFHTNRRAAMWLMDDSNLQRLAEAEAAMLAEFYGLTKTVRQKGDVNGDGKVDSIDYLMAKRIFLGTFKATPEQLWAADADGDGVVTAKDCLMIKRHYMGTYSIVRYWIDYAALMLEKANLRKGE